MTRRLSLNSNLTDVIARNGLDSVAALLDGDGRAPSNSASRSRMVGSTSVEDELVSKPFFFLILRAVKSKFKKRLRKVQLNVHTTKAGQMLAYFIMHRRPSANFISHELYMALTEGIASIQPTPNEICDYELSGQVEAIAAASNEEDFKAAVVKAVELINLAGCMNLTLHLNQDGQTTLVKSLTKFVLMEKNKKHWKEVFIFTIKPLDALQLDNMFDVKWLTEGSNRKCIERILVYWRDFLQDLEEGQGELFVTLKDLLAFTTGADEVPAHGFNFPLQLSFIHPEDLQDVAKCCTAGFPYANTCTMKLKIPVVNDYNTFQRNMAAAISMTVTFTNQ
ncbi:hypothetical protein ACJMK2_033341 [Sinanodonta woodiana]|uniref:HECT domain-containing protein n=1 Tax=Sinanodonta woodiana TaxID=1069815 RepID=A0ABD3WQ58_SINWO